MTEEVKTKAVFVISVAAELSGMHPQTLRIYERKGLVEPFRTPGGTRRYSEEDIERLTLIQHLTEQGLNLEGVRQVLALQEEVRALRRELDSLGTRMGELENEAARTIAEVHRSYKREMILRSEVITELPHKT